MDRFQKFFISSIVLSAITLLLLLFVIPQTSVDKETFRSLSNIRPEYLILAITIHIFAWFTWALRIKVMCSGIGSKISFLDSIKVVIPSLFAACITPSKFGGEPVRIYLLGKNGLSYGDATAVVIEERLLDALFMGLLVPITFILFKDYYNMALFPVFIVAATFMMLMVILLIYAISKPERTKKLVSRLIKSEDRANAVNAEIENFHTSIWKFIKEGRRYLLIGFLLTVPYWILDLAVASIILIGLGLDPMWIPSFVAQLVLVVVTILPLTPGSSGIAEVSMMSLYMVFVKNVSILSVFVLIWRFVMYYTNLIIGGIVGGAISFKILRGRNSE